MQKCKVGELGSMKETYQVVKKGKLKIKDFPNIQCANISKGKENIRAVSTEAFFAVVGFNSPQSGLKTCHELLTHRNIADETANALDERLAIPFVAIDNRLEVRYYDSALLVDFANEIINLNAQGVLDESWRDIALRCRHFIQASAKVGVASLIDEATGYAKLKADYEYRQMFEKYISDTKSSWMLEFKEPFFNGIYKIYNLQRVGRNHPSFFGIFILKYIYYPLAGSNGLILKKLDEKDPYVSHKGRSCRLHQYLSEELGKPALRDQLVEVTTLLKISKDKTQFKRMFMELHPKIGDQLELDFGDDEI